MKKHLMASLLLGLILLLAAGWIVSAKLPSGYGHTRGLYIFWDTPEDELNPPQYPVVGGFWRYNWAALEPTNDGYAWGAMDNWIQREQARGKLVGIGFSFFNKYSASGADRGLQMPSWLWGIDPEVRWRNTRRPTEYWYVPNYWNTTFRNYYRDFIEDFAQHLADNPAIRDRVAWVSMGVGLEGETQPACRWGCPGDEPDWYFYKDDKGITQAQWVEYVNWCSSTYKQAFSSRGLNIPIFLDIGPTYVGGGSERDQFSDYAASVGVGLRNNGLKMDRENGVIYEPMKEHWNTVPTAWETYGTPGWLDSKAAVFWGLMCGLAKHPDNFTVDRILVGTEEYHPLLQFASSYCAVTTANTPGVWVALRDTQPEQSATGERGNFSFWLTQKDMTGATTTAVWNVGADRRYAFDVSNGNYEVELHFAEIYYSGTGARIFDIVIEGQTVANNFDIVAAAGGSRKSIVRSFATTVSDGRLDVALVPDWNAGSKDYPVISALKVTGPSGYVQRINCGGKTYRDRAGNNWLYDREYESGSFGYIGGSTYVDTGVDITNTNDDYLYQSQRVFNIASQAVGRFARRTDQASGNRYMRFDIDGGYLYAGNYPQVTIKVYYFAGGTDAWELRYDSAGDANKLAGRVQKDGSGLWKQAVFYLTDAYFGNRQAGNTDFYIDCLNDGDEYISFVEVTKGSGPTPTPTTTPACTLQGSVSLQGRPSPPDPRWMIPLTVTVGSSNYTVTTDQSGNFSISGLTPGTYDIRVKNHHTLSNIRRSYSLVSGINTVNMGELKEGDANNDDRVNSSDFLLLRSSYFKCEGQPGFIDGSDFNEDGCVNSSDFLLLRTNYFQNGPFELSGAMAKAATLKAGAINRVSIALEPTSVVVNVGELFDLSVSINADVEEVAAADVYINFDPARLSVVDIVDQPGGLDFLNPPETRYDNNAGTINIGAGTLGMPVRGSFPLATLRFQAKVGSQGGATQISFSLIEPRKTVVKDAYDHNLLGAFSDAMVHINVSTRQMYTLYLPLVTQ